MYFKIVAWCQPLSIVPFLFFEDVAYEYLPIYKGAIGSCCIHRKCGQVVFVEIGK